MKFFPSIVFLSVVMACPALFADVLHLKDGGNLDGTLKHTDDGWTVTKDGKSVHVLTEQVESIELTSNGASTPKAAMQRLDSLRRSVDGLTDLNDIIARFQRFVDQNTDPVSTAEAKKDLAIWQDRLKQKMTKVGTKWVTAEDRAKLVEQAGANAETARQLMKQGRTIEAEPILVDVTAVDPTNATALYLMGLLRWQQEQIPAARKAFEATAAVVPNHAPTLNDLAIVLWRQKQYAAAMMDFDGAILATPVDRLLLDNVAAALQNLPPEFQKNQIALKLVKHFTEQDQQLSQIMAQQGMRRYGAIWVSEKDLARWKAEEQAIADKLDGLASDFDRSRQHIDQLTQTISDNTTQIHRIEATSFLVDPRTGVQTPVPYPQTYYDLVRDNQNAQREKDGEVGKLDQLKKQAVDLQNSRPSQKSQGVMRVVGPEGTPIRIPAAVAAPVAGATATQP
jgi:tetratricopeptide (TPR) repeat protein